MPSLPAISGELAILLQESKPPCVSVILPARLPGRNEDWKTIVTKANRELQLHFPNEALTLSQSLSQLLQESEMSSGAHGIGLFVADHVAQRITFPFPVQEKIIIDTQFHLREVLYKEQYGIPYLLLQLGETEARLYAGRFRELEEIRDGIFPMSYQVSAARQPLSVISQPETMEARSLRLSNIPLEIDNRLEEYFREDTALLVCGNHRHIAAFLNHSQHADKLIGAVPGNYGEADTGLLATMVWPTVKGWLEDLMEAAVSSYEEMIGEGKTVSGVENCWTAILEERGLMLLVEKDYQVPAYLEKGSMMLRLKLPQRPHRFLHDAIDVLIPIAFSKKVPVIIVGNGMLQLHGHMALKTRY